MQTLSTEEAVALLEAHAVWELRITCREPGCTDQRHRELTGGRYIHSLMAGLGVDWTLADAIKRVRDAVEVRWLPSVSGHDLVVVPPFGRHIMFNVAMPADVAA